MNNYLELKKQPVQYWSKVSSLMLAGLPALIELVKPKSTPDLNKSSKKSIDLVFGWLFLVVAVITYYTGYYTFSSLFWPEPSSFTNHLLLIPTTLWVAGTVYDKGTLLLGMSKE